MNETPLPLPSAEEMEEVVLASCVDTPGHLDTVRRSLSGEMFSRKLHQKMFSALCEMHDGGGLIDRDLLIAYMHKRGDLGLLNDEAPIVRVLLNASLAEDITSYVEPVREAWVRRVLIHRCKSLSQRAFVMGETLEDILEQAASLCDGMNVSNDSPWTLLGEAVDEAGERARAAAEDPDGAMGVSLGLEDLDDLTCGLRGGDYMILGARPSMGKMQPLYSKVLTRSGWKRMGDVRIGDTLASPDGSPSVVTGIFPHGEKEVYRIFVGDGRYADCGLEHLWKVSCDRWATPEKVVDTAFLIQALCAKRNRGRIKIQPISGDFGEDRNFPIHPYVLGVLIGNGNLTNRTVRITLRDQDVAVRTNALLSHGYELRHHGGLDYIIVRAKGKTEKGIRGVLPNKYKETLKSMGLLGKRSEGKFIPPDYLHASKASRLALMQGLMDTDGTVEKSGSLRYSTSSKRLSEDIQKLAWSLGALCRITRKKPKYTYRGEVREGLTAYILSVRRQSPEDFVYASRKKERTKNRAYPRAWLTIDKIEHIGQAQCQCISVSHPKGLYITDDYITTHNTALALWMARKCGVRVAFISAEMSSRALTMRMLATEAEVDMHAMRRGRLSPSDLERLEAARESLRGVEVYVADTLYNTSDIFFETRRLHREHGVGLVIIDYIQLLEGIKGSRGETREQEVTKISRAAKQMAIRLDVPVVALAQLSRAVESREDKRPRLSDLRESGSLEQDADLVAFLYREGYYNPNESDKTTEIIVAKQRNGPTGTVHTYFDPTCGRFSDLSPR